MLSCIAPFDTCSSRAATLAVQRAQRVECLADHQVRAPAGHPPGPVSRGAASAGGWSWILREWTSPGGGFSIGHSDDLSCRGR